MAYNIFIDTSIFKNQCFDIENRQFKSLERLRLNGLINLFITDVVKAEVENRIKLEVEEGSKIIKKQARTIWVYLNVKKEEIKQNLLDKFNTYIERNFSVINVPENGIGKRVINNYLKNNPPFDTSKEDKKHEFPDAFIIETIAYFLEKNNVNGIFLSSDHDCVSFIHKNDRLSYVGQIGELLDRLNRENEDYTNQISQAINNRNSNLEKSLNLFLSNLDIDNYAYETNEFSHNALYDFNISGVDYVDNSLDFSRTNYEIYDIDPDSNYVQLALTVGYQVNSLLDADDYNNACYDKEEDKYYFVESIVIDNSFQVEDVEIIVGLDTLTGEFEVISEPEEIHAEFNIDEPLDEDS